MTVPELFGDPAQWPDDDLIAITGVLSPHLVLAALHEGVFPMPITGDEVPRELRGATAWWSPMRRGILLPGDFCQPTSRPGTPVPFPRLC